MPEGIGPASGHLQSVVASLFSDFEKWTVAIFDNLLVCAYDYDDLYSKLVLIFDRCIERNVYLKFAKSFIGFDSAHFFGYRVSQGSYALTQERKDDIMATPFPSGLKELQSFLGCSVFFNAFIPYYSDLCAPLHDMTKKDFNWKDRTTWTVDYPAIFDKFKSALLQACALHYPDYSLDWILRVDASTYGCAAALLMKQPQPDGSHKLLPISFVS